MSRSGKSDWRFAFTVPLAAHEHPTIQDKNAGIGKYQPWSGACQGECISSTAPGTLSILHFVDELSNRPLYFTMLLLEAFPL